MAETHTADQQNALTKQPNRRNNQSIFIHIQLGSERAMNKSESKYFNTAIRMDKAFLALLEKKDFEYITVKEFCTMAGVNRSTFYLHYENMGDLLEESIHYMHRQFLVHMRDNSIETSFVRRLHDCPLNELYLVTPEYLQPYLSYIQDNKRLFRTAMNHAEILQLQGTYSDMFKHVFTPILDRFNVPEHDRPYMMSFYVHGLMAIVETWLKNDCADSIDYVMEPHRPLHPPRIRHVSRIGISARQRDSSTEKRKTPKLTNPATSGKRSSGVNTSQSAACRHRRRPV